MQTLFQIIAIPSIAVQAFLVWLGVVWLSEIRPTGNKIFLISNNIAMVLGLSISSMFYSAVSANDFVSDRVIPASNSWWADNQDLAYSITSLTVLIMLIALFTSIRQRRIALWKTLLIVGLSELTIMLMLPVVVPKNTSVLTASALDVFFLMLFVSPVAWRLQQAMFGLYQKQQEAERNLHSQNAINQLLSLPLHGLDLEELLSHAIKIIINISWLKVVMKGGVFLRNSNDVDFKRVVLVDKYEDIRPQILEKTDCPFCQSQITSSQDEQNFSHLQIGVSVCIDKAQHSHYLIPLIFEKRLNGFLNFYLETDCCFKPVDADILKVLASTLAKLIRSKQTLIDLGLANTVFNHSLTCLIVGDAENKILNINPAFTTVTGYTIDDLRGKLPTVFSSLSHDEVFYADIAKQLKENGNWQGEVWDRKKNGEIFLQWLSITVVYDHKGQIKNYISAFADITHQKEAEKRIRQLAYFDSLTGLANRTLFYDRLEQSIMQAKRNRTKLALLFIDLDRFKEVNDTLGHDAGDELLKTVAVRIRSCLRESDVLARLGGDEFVVLLKDLDGTSTINELGDGVGGDDGVGVDADVDIFVEAIKGVVEGGGLAAIGFGEYLHAASGDLRA